MEYLFLMFVHFVLWLDRMTLRSLRRVVPNVEELRSNPARVLAEEDITIGPTSRWPSTLALSAILGFVTWFGFSWLYLWLSKHPRGVPLDTVEKWVVFAIFLVSFFVVFRLLLYFRRGGSLILTAHGVEFRHRSRVLHCPWALFDTTGHPFFSSRERVLLPVNPRAVPHVKLTSGDHTLTEGMKATAKGFRFQSVNLAAIQAFYEVVPAELANLLLVIGRKMHAPLPYRETSHLDPEEPPADEIPAIVQLPNGALTANLTRLSLPPFCCACQRSTNDRKMFYANQISLRLLGLRLLELGHTVTLMVPVCSDCTKRSRQTKWRGLVFGLFASFGFFIGLAILAFKAKGLEPLPGILILLAVANLLLTPALGFKMGDARSRQVLIDRYNPAYATVNIWFRSRRYTDAVMELHENHEELTSCRL